MAQNIQSCSYPFLVIAISWKRYRLGPPDSIDRRQRQTLKFELLQWGVNLNTSMVPGLDFDNTPSIKNDIKLSWLKGRFSLDHHIRPESGPHMLTLPPNCNIPPAYNYEVHTDILSEEWGNMYLGLSSYQWNRIHVIHVIRWLLPP